MANAEQENFDGQDAPPVAAMVESIIGCKWSMQVLSQVRAGVHRPGELERACPGISTKVLNERLHKLNRFGILDRRVYPERPPRVEYHFTRLGEQFLGIIDEVNRVQSQLDSGATPNSGA